MPSLRVGTGGQVKVIASGALGGGGGGKLVLLSDVDAANLTNGASWFITLQLPNSSPKLNCPPPLLTEVNSNGRYYSPKKD